MKMALGAPKKFSVCNFVQNKHIEKQTQEYDIKYIFLCVHEKRNNKILLEKKEQKFLEKSLFCMVFGTCRIYSNEFKPINHEFMLLTWGCPGVLGQIFGSWSLFRRNAVKKVTHSKLSQKYYVPPLYKLKEVN